MDITHPLPSSLFGEVDAYLFSKGVHYHLYEVMGGRLAVHRGVSGARFVTWAPNAKSIAVVGDFNHWDQDSHPMRLLEGTGVWECFIPGVKELDLYKFAITTSLGGVILKADPYALQGEYRPGTASRICQINRFQFTDKEWIEKQRTNRGKSFPLNIYEVHLNSWKKKDPPLGYRELAHLLAAYCKEMGFSHIEILPICEHPLDESWGYQVTGFFAATSRYGSPEDFQYFVNHMHQEGIGVILDWVPAHFPVDDHSFGRFDGTPLYEHRDSRQGFHPHWNTHIFNYGRFEVSNFLIASALFWLDKMHIDGLRVDAVASMLYLDYGRKEGEWIPNIYGGRENLEAIEFLKHLNAVIHERFPHCLTFAEESTSFPAVTYPLESGGLGFDFKWNMGWMNDALRYFQRDCLFRSHHQHELTFSILYAFSEKFLLPLSHDEVVHGKGSLLSKMPGDDWQKFANLRLLISYQICQPGKKLLFMGAELGQWEEWDSQKGLFWERLHQERHTKLHKAIKEINHFYLDHPALWELDSEGDGFEWVSFADRVNGVICYLRKGKRETLLCVHHFTPTVIPSYFIPLSQALFVKEVLNTDREEYGGSGRINTEVIVANGGIEIEMPPLATAIFYLEYTRPLA